MAGMSRDGLITFVVTVLFLVFSWVAVSLRFTIRWRKHSLGFDDWLMGVGLLLFTVVSVLVLIICSHGAGFLSDDLDPEDIRRGTKYYFISQFFYVSGTVPIKTSICVALLRIAGVNRLFSYALYFIIGLTTITAFICIIAIANICHPAPAMWGDAEGECNSSMNSGIGFFLSAVCIVTDWSLAILPALMLWQIKLKRSLKVSVSFVLGLAAIASSATIVRLRFLTLYDNDTEFMYSAGKIAVWSILEEGIGIVAGSLPMLRPLLKYIPFVSSAGHSSETPTGGRGVRTYRRTDDALPLETVGGSGATETRVTKMKGDGDSQRYILKETEFTMSEEPPNKSDRNGWAYGRIE